VGEFGDDRRDGDDEGQVEQQLEWRRRAVGSCESRARVGMLVCLD
jgi:hypothetical protein